jgi:hypothetical protein
MKWNINNWLVGLLKVGSATKTEIDKLELITINSNCSNWFGVGVDLEGNSPFIAVQDAFYPWFGMLKWDLCIVDLKRNVMCLVIEGSDKWLGVGITIRKDRVGWLWSDGVGDEISIRRIKFKEKKIMISNEEDHTMELLIVPDIESHMRYLKAEEAQYYIEEDIYEGFEEEH